MNVSTGLFQKRIGRLSRVSFFRADVPIILSLVVLVCFQFTVAGAPVDGDSLVGHNAADVKAALGQPTGKLQTTSGSVWLYSGWRIQFDASNRVMNVEQSASPRSAPLDPQWAARLDSADKIARDKAAAEDAARVKARAAEGAPMVKVISNGGANVDLPSLLVEGKVTVVDFYATWCGPCMRLAPSLEDMAKKDSDIVLIKIDIANWGTPVAKQFALSSIPHVRVYDGRKNQIGSATSSLEAVLQNVKSAKARN